MTPAELANLHRSAFQSERNWSADEFADLLLSPHVTLIAHSQGFALIRIVAGEAELLTLAVHPDHHRQGIATRLMTQWMSDAAAQTAFLEVAADNLAAQNLYRKHGFAEAGRRRGYYKRSDGTTVDAVLMTAALPCGQGPESPRTP
ncbi:GNAT family N-acetyltransferase [uncultured Roseobacter sp.]|uniref:GNAT family N-acetyltransferase n=1 Tax=uncultured Roseobacter sp. TaxID=114847 RepID=UPI002623F87F|nr:GNAT family N-acetyltransferase [uncultured Roseobacter sp.]